MGEIKSEGDFASSGRSPTSFLHFASFIFHAVSGTITVFCNNCGFSQIDCLICLPDRSGNFHTYRAIMSDNSIKFRKTGFGLVNQTAPEPVFFIFKGKIPRTFWGKCTEQSSRKKLAVGGLEPEIWFESAHLPHKRLHFCLPRQECSFFAFQGKTGSKREKSSKIQVNQGLGAVKTTTPRPFFRFRHPKPVKNAGVLFVSFSSAKTYPL